LYGQGIHKVVIDDMLPVNENGRVVFAHQSLNDAWWLPLLEKGAAKFYGTYDKMHAGWGTEAFVMLTGYPVKRYYHTENSNGLAEE